MAGESAEFQVWLDQQSEVLTRSRTRHLVEIPPLSGLSLMTLSENFRQRFRQLLILDHVNSCTLLRSYCRIFRMRILPEVWNRRSLRA